MPRRWVERASLRRGQLWPLAKPDPKLPGRRATCGVIMSGERFYHELVSHTRRGRDLVDAVARGEESADLVLPFALGSRASTG